MKRSSNDLWACGVGAVVVVVAAVLGMVGTNGAGVLEVLGVVVARAVLVPPHWVFLGHSRAIWPCKRHLKQHPSAMYCFLSSGVSFLKGIVGAVEVTSMSIGTTPSFLCGWGRGFWV